jgi:hypothetical protein
VNTRPEHQSARDAIRYAHETIRHNIYCPELAWLIEHVCGGIAKKLLFIGSWGRELGIRRGREVESRETREQ